MNEHAGSRGRSLTKYKAEFLTSLLGALAVFGCGNGDPPSGAGSGADGGLHSGAAGSGAQPASGGRVAQAGGLASGASSGAGAASSGTSGGVSGGGAAASSSTGAGFAGLGVGNAGNGIGGAATSGGTLATVGGGSAISSGGAGAHAVGGSAGMFGGAATTSGGAAVTGGVAGSAALGGTSAFGGALVGGAATGNLGGSSYTGGAVGIGGFGGVPNTMDPCTGHFQMESLDRGLVAIAVSGGVYVGWRMSGCEYNASDPTRIRYNLYRDGSLLDSVTDSTNYFDATGTTTSAYTIRAVLAGVERPESASVSAWSKEYLSIPLDIPASGVVDRVAASQTDAAYSYNANDGSTGDLDGDGQYEIVLKWDPTNSRDNSLTGFTGNVLVDAYRLDGTKLWRIDLGKNIRAGAHYTQFLVYDFDGDGRAEVAMKTAPGTRDGLGQYLRSGPAATDDDTADYRRLDGMVLSGNEYLTVFDGRTGAELATTYFVVDRSLVSDWGDTTGNRVDRFLASAAFVSDVGLGQAASGRPSLLMARGYYTRATISAWNWRGGELSRIWLADSYPSTNTTTSAYGQGAHSMAVADADQDGAQEVIYGSATIDSDGTFKCSTGFGHGDALHVSDLVPTRAGLEVMMPLESSTGPSYSLRDAGTCEVLLRGPVRGVDTGRGVAGDVFAGNPGAELWAAGSALVSATTGANVGTIPTSANFLVWWDADESRELLDGTSVTKYGGTTLLKCTECASNNGTKATPVLTADLFGDWREEIVWRTSDNATLRVYTTTAVTTRRIYTLMHDAQYRMQVSSEQTAYNQPPHPSFHIGDGMAAPPQPNIWVK